MIWPLDLNKSIFNKKNFFFILCTFIIGSLFYSSFLAYNLTNNVDGLWDKTYFFLDDWGLSLGRWVWFVIERVIQGCYIEPYNSLLSILLFSIGYLLIIKTINFNENKFVYILGIVFILTTTVCCMLSYRTFMFALSFFLSVLSSYCLTKINDGFLSIFISSIFLVLSLGTYQSNIACFCLAILFSLLVQISNDFDVKKITIVIVRTILTIIISCITYKISWDLTLKVFNVEVADYMGANTVSIFSILLNLPQNILKAYFHFFGFYSGSDGYVTNSYPFVVMALWIENIIMIIYLFVQKKKTNFDSWIKLCFSLLLFILIPIASNFALLLVDSGIQFQQTLSISFVLPLITVFNICFLNENHSKFNQLSKCVIIFTFVVFFFGNVLSVNKDIEAMKQGKAATESMVENICDEIINNDYYDENERYFFFGKPSENELFNVNEIWYVANDYARVGDFLLNAWRMPASYQGVIDDLGINLHCNFSSNEEFNEYVASGIVDNMPCYPNEGYILKTEDGYTLIKISNNY